MKDEGREGEIQRGQKKQKLRIRDKDTREWAETKKRDTCTQAGFNRVLWLLRQPAL